MAAFAGLYWNRENDTFVKIFVKEGKLEGDLGGGESLVLKPFGESQFHIADKPWGDEVEIHFVAASGDEPKRMERSDGGGKARVYEAEEPFTPGGAELGRTGRRVRWKVTFAPHQGYLPYPMRWEEVAAMVGRSGTPRSVWLAVNKPAGEIPMA
jgi:hypothetical protein